MKNLLLLSSLKDKKYLVFLFFIGILFYGLTIRGVYGSPSAEQIIKKYDHAATPFESSHERGPYVLILSLVQNHSFGFSQRYADASNPDVGYYKGKYYIFFAPGISLLALPLFLLGSHFNLGQVGAFFTIVIFSAATLVFLFKIARETLKMPLWSSLFSALTFGFASIAWSYSVTIYQHQVTTFFLIFAFYAAWKFKQQGKQSWLWACLVWFAYAASIFVDYPNAILLFPVMVYFLLSAIHILRNRNSVTISLRLTAVFTSIIFIVVCGVHGYYNYKNFGSPTRLSGSLVGYREIKKQQLLVATKGKQAALDAQAEKKSNPVGFFHEEHVTNGLYELLVSVDRGILLFSPIFLLALLGIFLSFGSISLEAGILLAIILTDLFLYSSFGDPYGGWSYGPRYLIPAMAALSLFVGVFITKLKSNLIIRIVSFVFFGVSAAIALLGALTTNLIPPSVEAIPLNLRYDFLGNITYLRNNVTGNFIYNQFLSTHMTLQSYYLVILEVLLVIAYAVLFLVPMYKKNEMRQEQNNTSRTVMNGLNGSSTTYTNNTKVLHA